MTFLSTRCLGALAAGAFVAGLATQAHAGVFPPFTVQPNSLPGVSGIPGDGGAPAGSFIADSASGQSSELLTNAGGGVVNGTGYFQLGGWSLNGSGVLGTGMNVGPVNGPSTYGVYVTFNLSGTLTSGTIGPNQASTFNLTSLTFSMLADPNSNDVFTAATGDGTSGTPTSISGTAGDVLLGTGTLVPGTGFASFTAGGNPALNSTEAFSLTAAGKNFFILPVPFYDFALDEFNSTSVGAVFSKDGTIAVNAGGSVNFAVPEPASLALLGSALVGMGVGIRRRKKNVA